LIDYYDRAGILAAIPATGTVAEIFDLVQAELARR